MTSVLIFESDAEVLLLIMAHLLFTLYYAIIIYSFIFIG